MKYKGIELVEITEPQIFNPPKLMLVWDANEGSPVGLNVYAIIDREGPRVIAERTDWKHCAEIPEQKLATYCELSQWLAKGNGYMKKTHYSNMVYTNLSYDESLTDDPIGDSILVRKWKDTEWHKPTREYLGLEDL